jgi:hypothetical protein
MALAPAPRAGAQGPARASNRAPLGPRERQAITALLDAVDVAQRDGTDADARFPWDTHVLKSLNHRAYVPFIVSLEAVADSLKSGVLYVRAVTRSSAAPSIEQRSELRDWLRGAQPTPRMGESVSLAVGELPVGGPAVSSSRRNIQAAAESSTILELQHRAAEREKEQEARLRKMQEERDPSLFPFEEYYFFDAKLPRPDDRRLLGRAMAIPSGEYDLYIAFLDRAHIKDGKPIVLERRITVPDFWNDELRLSSLILTNDMKMLPVQLQKKEQSEQPYTFGLARAVPNLSQTFSTKDVLTVVYQICNYGAPGAEMSAEYRFYHVDGSRKLFNGTPPQELTDDDLPPTVGWETQAFAMQLVPLAPFAPGKYEIEVTVRDRTTRSTAIGVAAFSVK